VSELKIGWSGAEQ